MEPILIKFTADTGGLDEVNIKLGEFMKLSDAVLAKMNEISKAKPDKSMVQGINEQSKAQEGFADAIDSTNVSLIDIRKSIDDLSNAQKNLTKTIPAKVIQKAYEGVSKEIINVRKELETTLNESKQRVQEQEAAIKNLQGQYEQLNASINKTEPGIEQQKLIKQYNALGNEIKAEIGTLIDFEKEVKSNENALKTYDAQVVATAKAQNQAKESSSSLATELRRIKDEMIHLEQSGMRNTEQYDKLRQKAESLATAQAVVNREIKEMSSATQGFDTALQSVQLLAGGFSVAQGAMAIFGDESEDVQKLMVKLQAAIAITTGLQQVQNAVQKESNIMRAVQNLQLKAGITAQNLETSIKSKNIVVTKLATAAQWALNVAASANPYVLLATAIASLVGVLYIFIKSSSDAREEEEKHAETMRRLRDEFDSTNDAIESIINRMRAQGETEEEILEKTRDLYWEEESYYRRLAEGMKMAGKEMTKAQRERYDELSQMADDYSRKATKANEDLANSRIRKEREENEKALKEAERAEDERKKKAEQINRQRLQELIKIEKELADYRIKAIEDEQEREIAAIELNNQRRIDAIKGNTQAENELRIQYEQNAQNEILNVRRKYENQAINEQLEIEKLGIESRLIMVDKWSEEEYNLRVQLAKKEADLATERVRQSTASEDLKAAQILKINSDLAANIKQIDEDVLENEKRIADERVRIEKEQADEKLRIEKELAEKRKRYLLALADSTLDTFSSLSNSLTTLQTQRLNQQLSDLQNYYTTDVEEAKENANLKLISEQEYANREKAIKAEIAAKEKKQAIADAVINSAQAIVKTFSQWGWPLGAVFAALVAAQTAAQIAVIRNQPTGYWKGRKKGRGEMALVGEYGPEIMYVPEGATIVPANHSKKILSGDANVARNWDIPAINNIPMMPTVSQEFINQYSGNMSIDYDKLGKAVAKYQKQPVLNSRGDVKIQVDAKGITEYYSSGSYIQYRNRRYGKTI